MNLQKLSEPLNINEIDFRIQSINKGKYATLLAYKDARVDMNRLDEVCGPLNWKREHTRDNQNCIVSIWDETKKQWISKEDTGTESFSEKEKGLASDSFKRACFNWGIGRELYDYPVIQIKLKDNEVYEKDGKFRPTFELKLREWEWKSYFNNGDLIQLEAIDTSGTQRYKYVKNMEATGHQLILIEDLLRNANITPEESENISRSMENFNFVRAEQCIDFLKENKGESLNLSKKEINDKIKQKIDLDK